MYEDNYNTYRQEKTMKRWDRQAARHLPGLGQKFEAANPFSEAVAEGEDHDLSGGLAEEGFEPGDDRAGGGEKDGFLVGAGG
jgi:hypothetical protein